jgi:hypothetical protein
MSIVPAEQFRKDQANNKADSASRRRREAADKLLSDVIVPTATLMAGSGISTAVINMDRNLDIIGLVSKDLEDAGYTVQYRRLRHELVVSW